MIDIDEIMFYELDNCEGIDEDLIDIIVEDGFENIYCYDIDNLIDIIKVINFTNDIPSLRMYFDSDDNDEINYYERYMHGCFEDPQPHDRYISNNELEIWANDLLLNDDRSPNLVNINRMKGRGIYVKYERRAGYLPGTIYTTKGYIQFG